MVRPQGGGLSLGMLYCGAYSDDELRQEDVYVAYNFSSSETTLALPKVGKHREWYLTIDSSDEKMPYLTKPNVWKDGMITLPPQTIRVLAGKEMPYHKKKAAGKKEQGREK